MGELIPHSYLLIEEMIKNLKDEYKKTNRLPFMHRAEYESLVLDTIRRDASDVEDPNDVVDVTKFLHERGKDCRKTDMAIKSPPASEIHCAL